MNSRLGTVQALVPHSYLLDYLWPAFYVFAMPLAPTGDSHSDYGAALAITLTTPLPGNSLSFPSGESISFSPCPVAVQASFEA